MIDCFIKRPFLSVLGMCLLFFITAGIFFNSRYLSVGEIDFIAISFLLIFSLKSHIERLGLALSFMLILAIEALLSLGNMFLLLPLMIGLWFVIYKKGLNKNNLTFGIIASAFLLHLFFVINASVDLFQHDLSGTRLYMSLIAKNGLNWRDFDPWYMYYLFHQPLHFFILQNVFLFEEWAWQSNTLSLEGLQYISLLYISFTSIFIAKICIELKFKKKIFYAILTFISFNPTLTLFCGYISDDVPALFWSSATFYFLIKWYKTNLIKHIVFCAICFGLGCLSKLSILLSVPAISWLFCIKLIEKEHRKDIIKGISLFIIIAVPLSLIWIIRNHILFDMQFYNVPDTSPMGQNFKYLTLWERMTDFSMLSVPFIDAPHIVDANILLALVKTELFGEWDFSKINNSLYTLGTILYAVSLALKMVVIIGAIYILIAPCNKLKNIMIFFVILYVSSILYALKYAIDYPYICSTDYRLFTLLLISEGMILANFADKNRAINKLLYLTCAIYAGLSFVIYVLVVS